MRRFEGRRTLMLLTAVTGLLFSPQPAMAQRVGNRVVNLKIDMATGTYWLTNVDGSVIAEQGRTEGGSLVANNDIFLDKGNVAKIYIAKANPLVYRYAAKKGEPVDTADFKAASQMLNIIKTLVASLGGAPGAGLAARAISNDDAVREVFARHNFKELKDWEQFLTALDSAVDALSGKAAQMPTLFERSKSDQTAVKKTVCTDDSCSWGVSDLEQTLTTSFKKLKDLNKDLLDLYREQGVLDGEILAAMQLAMNQEADAIKTLPAVKTFAANVAKIDTDILLDQGASYSPNKDLPIDVTRTQLTLTGTETKDVTKYTFTFRPNSGVTFGFGTMFAYTWVRVPSYTGVVKDGQLVIAEKKSEEFTGQKVAGVFAISRTRWVDTFFSPSFEFGVNPEKNKIGLFLGLGFQASGLFHVGFGYAAIQVPQLDGQSVDDPITSLDAIKTKPKFEQGPYAHFTITAKIGG